MRSKEITSGLDKIFELSGVEKYIKTPIKSLSSGTSKKSILQQMVQKKSFYKHVFKFKIVYLLKI